MPRYFEAGYTYEIVIPMSSLGTLYTGPATDVTNFIQDHIDDLVKQYFTPDSGYILSSVLRAELKPVAVLWFLYVTTPHITEPVISDTVEGLCAALRQRYGITIARRDRSGIPAPWVYMHGYTGPIRAPRRNILPVAVAVGGLAYATYKYATKSGRR